MVCTITSGPGCILCEMFPMKSKIHFNQSCFLLLRRAARQQAVYTDVQNLQGFMKPAEILVFTVTESHTMRAIL